jgi:hypothetical protein
MILQMVRNECVRFGGHINIQVSYKILWLEVLKKALILHNPTCFQEGLLLGNFGLNAAFRCLGVNVFKMVGFGTFLWCNS